MSDHREPQPPVMPDFSREDRIWNRIIFTGVFGIAGILLFALALPALRERFF